MNISVKTPNGLASGNPPKMTRNNLGLEIEIIWPRWKFTNTDLICSRGVLFSRERNWLKLS